MGNLNRGFRDRPFRLLTILRASSRVLLPAVLLLATVPSLAEEAPRVPVDQKVTEQKALFLGRLVTRSVAADKIEQSGDVDAMANLAAARTLVQEADTALKAGDYLAANDKLDAALELVNRETRRLSEPEVAAASLRKSYDRRLQAVRTFLAAYERVAEEKESISATVIQVAEIRRLIGEAEAAAAGGDLKQGIAELDRAYRTARGDIRELRDGETLTRSLDFGSPEAEYDYERNRNDSHVMLLKFALSERQPGEERMAAIEKLRLEASRRRGEGENWAGVKDYPKAIDALSQSTDSLLKAIRMSGVYIPG